MFIYSQTCFLKAHPQQGQVLEDSEFLGLLNKLLDKAIVFLSPSKNVVILPKLSKEKDYIGFGDFLFNAPREDVDNYFEALFFLKSVLETLGLNPYFQKHNGSMQFPHIRAMTVGKLTEFNPDYEVIGITFN